MSMKQEIKCKWGTYVHKHTSQKQCDLKAILKELMLLQRRTLDDKEFQDLMALMKKELS